MKNNFNFTYLLTYLLLYTTKKNPKNFKRKKTPETFEKIRLLFKSSKLKLTYLLSTG